VSKPPQNFSRIRRTDLLALPDALSHGELFHLDMGLLKAANSSALEWVDVEKAPYSSDYEPVMALAQNHVFFLNVTGVSAGSAAIYVIHCKSKLTSTFPGNTADAVGSRQSTTSSLTRKPSRRLMGQSPRPMVGPPHSSETEGYETSVLYSIHCIHFIRIRYKKNSHSSRTTALRLMC
jgi:hypothetical protein